jgi:hypothetical protein
MINFSDLEYTTSSNSIVFYIKNDPILQIYYDKIIYLDENLNKVVLSDRKDLIFALNYFLKYQYGDLNSFYKDKTNELLNKLNEKQLRNLRNLKLKLIFD